MDNKRGGKRVSVGMQQQTNKEHDPQFTVELLQQFASQNISQKIEEMRPEIEAKIGDLVKSETDAIVEEIKNSRTELHNVKNSVLGAVAVFAAFFTFVSVNVNIFTKSNAFESMGLMIVMWICLMGFTYTFFLFLWEKWREIKYWLPVVVGMIVTCAILWAVKPAEASNQEANTPKTDVQIPSAK